MAGPKVSQPTHSGKKGYTPPAPVIDPTFKRGYTAPPPKLPTKGPAKPPG